MKVWHKALEQDSTHNSVQMIRTQMELFLKDENIDGPLWMPDDPLGQISFHDKDEIVNILLTGQFLRSFLESGIWPTKRKRLFVLCQAVKDVMSSLLGFDKKQIAVVPRQKLFPYQENIQAFPYQLSSFDFIYGGRISRTKNILTLIAFISALQKKEVKAKLNIFGQFDDEYDQDFGRRVVRPFIDEYGDFLKWLKMPDPPTLDYADSKNWTQHIDNNPIFISFSTQIMEDFGVSLSQSLQQKWPAILSGWGGHLNLTNGPYLFVKPSLIGNSYESWPLIRDRGELLAELFINKKLQTIVDDNQSYKMPEFILDTDLDKQRKNFFKQYGYGPSLILRDRLPYFADSFVGYQFFNQYRQIFSREEILNYVIYEEGGKFCYDFCEKGFKSIPLSQLARKEVVFELQKAQNIWIYLTNKKLEKTLMPLLPTHAIFMRSF